MRRPSSVILGLCLIYVAAACGADPAPASNSKDQTSNVVGTTTGSLLEADGSVSDGQTPSPAANQTTTSRTVEAPGSTSEADDVGGDDSEGNTESDTGDSGNAPTTAAPVPVTTTTYEIISEEPADVLSGGPETWEPDA